MNIKEAINKAIEGGYKRDPMPTVMERMSNGTFRTEYDWTQIFWDPSFWQSLGKAMGWTEEMDDEYGVYTEGWLASWHRFIDHLAKEKSPESFFETLT